MKQSWICFYRKSCGKCLWASIIEMNQKLNENKQNEISLIHRINEFENSFFEKVTSNDETLFQLDDGFMGKTTFEKSSIANNPSKCIYQKYGCEDILRLKKRVLSYHFHQYMALLEKYNQLGVLVGHVNRYHRSLLIRPENIALVYEKQPYLVMGYCPIVPEKDFKDHPLTLSIFGVKDQLNVFCVPILLKYHLSKEVLKDTYWIPQNNDILVELIWNREIEKQLLKPMAQCMHEWINKWNVLYKRHHIKIGGWYMEVGNLEQELVVVCESLRAEQSYQILGRVKDGVFKEKQLITFFL